MLRCTPLLRHLATTLALGASAWMAAAPATAQNTPPTALTGQRNFPEAALRGTLVVTQPPHITLDGKPAQLSPGARIKGANNLLVMSASLVGQELTVNYTTEQLGLVHEIWILNAAEAAEKRKRAGQ